MTPNEPGEPSTAAPKSPTAEGIEALRQNWKAEVETARVYRDLAAREADEKRKGILLRMAVAEERHAARWEQKLKDLGVMPPALADTFSRRLSRWWNRVAGPEIAIRRMEVAEDRHEARYRVQSERALADDPSVSLIAVVQDCSPGLSARGANNYRPNVTCDPNEGGAGTPAQWFNTSCFQRLTLAANAGQVGNEARNVVRGPGFNRVAQRTL